MVNRREWWILFIKTFVHFKCNIEMDLDFYVRVRTCKKRVTGKQPLVLDNQYYQLLLVRLVACWYLSLHT